MYMYMYVLYFVEFVSVNGKMYKHVYTNTRLSALDLRLDLSLCHLTRQSCRTWARKAIAFSVGAMFLCRLYRPHVVA